MALIHCFIPRSALGPGFGKTISATIFFCLLGPVAFVRGMLPGASSFGYALIQGTGILVLGLWFAYFVALNYKEDFLQRSLVISATVAQAALILLTANVLGLHYRTIIQGEEFGPSGSMLTLQLVTGTMSSGFLLGAVTMAMLIGHWYLVIPGLSIDWLKGACLAYGGAIAIKVIAIAIALTIGALGDPFGPRGFFDSFLAEGFQLFVVRVIVGIAIPFAFCVLAYKAAAMRATQSSTGILFPAMIVVFIGEMMAAYLIIGTGGLSL